MTKQEKKKGLDLGLLPSLIGYQVRLAQIEVFEDFAQALAEFELSPGRFGVLVLIEANPGLNQGQLAAASRLDRSTMVSVIDYLEGRGLVVRKPSPTDRRTNALWLTPKGKTLVGQMKPLIAQHEERVLADLSAAERATLIDLLSRIKGKKRA
jgi:DNA-binding MarR family transcriptional regulator